MIAMEENLNADKYDVIVLLTIGFQNTGENMCLK